MTRSNPARAGSDGPGGQNQDTPSLTPDHAALLESSAIPVDVAIAAGVYSVTSADQMPDGLRWGGSGIMFQHHPLHGDPVPQYRPDNPKPGADGTVRKYLFPPGSVPLNVVPAMRSRIVLDERVLIVEGTKQTLAAVAHAPDDVLVVGVAGCWAWSRDGQANPELAELCQNRDVVVCLDADATSNIKVHQAAARLGAHLEAVGATSVRHVTIPASGTVGLDDYLAQVPDPGAVLARLIDGAGKLGKAPKATVGADEPGGQFFDKNGLRVVDVVGALRRNNHLAVGPDGSIWGYTDGVYRDSSPVVAALGDLLGQRYRPLHRKAVEELLVAGLRADGRTLADAPKHKLINVENGMLDVVTGKLKDHSPNYLSHQQLPVKWDPKATCPYFDEWLIGRCGTQADDLIEAAGVMLTPWVGQRRSLFLYGPSRSGKGTFLRVLEELAGRHASAVTLHALTSERFAAANLYGAIVNCAGDLSDAHIDDLSTFKMATGDDPVMADRKYRDPYTFHIEALFAFSANTPPTVAETSRAYLARMRPYYFGSSYEGHEDQAVENKILAERPGILVALVHGAQAWISRGGYAPANPMVTDDFARQSDVAALFVGQVVASDPGGFVTAQAIYENYVEWAHANGRHRLGRNKLLRRVDNTLGERQRAQGAKTGGTGWRDVKVLPVAEWLDGTDPDPASFSSGPASSGSPDPGDDQQNNPGPASFASFSPLPAHEEMRDQEGREGAFPREGGIGPNRAKDAGDGESPPDHGAQPEPDLDAPHVRQYFTDDLDQWKERNF
ncbi:hypothetical protein BH23ACT2_BH23ACT2_01580 [soil metagenome]